MQADGRTDARADGLAGRQEGKLVSWYAGMQADRWADGQADWLASWEAGRQEGKLAGK